MSTKKSRSNPSFGPTTRDGPHLALPFTPTLAIEWQLYLKRKQYTAMCIRLVSKAHPNISKALSLSLADPFSRVSLPKWHRPLWIPWELQEITVFPFDFLLFSFQRQHSPSADATLRWASCDINFVVLSCNHNWATGSSVTYKKNLLVSSRVGVRLL